MRYHALLSAFLTVLTPAAAWATELRQWQAASSTAMGITGDVTFSSNRITFGNKKSLPLASGSKISFVVRDGKEVEAILHRVTAPAELKLLHENRLCYGKPVTYIVVWIPTGIGSDAALRSMSPFSGSQRPASEASPQSCGTFSYESAPSR